MGEVGIQYGPSKDVIAKVAGKRVFPSGMTSAQWAGMPAQIRDAALFSARVENARVLQSIKDALTQWAEQAPDREVMDAGRFVRDLRVMMGAEPGDSGEITDITSQKRLKLIWDTQTQSAQGYGNYVSGMDKDSLDAFPAQELVRFEGREEPRDWESRWREAAQASGDGHAYRVLVDHGRMVALKTSGIWSMLGNLWEDSLGNPWPPFAFNSGMDVMDVGRDEAEGMGLIEKTEERSQETGARSQESGTGQIKPFVEGMQASLADLDPETQAALLETFGDQVEVVDGVLQWRGK